MVAVATERRASTDRRERYRAPETVLTLTAAKDLPWLTGDAALKAPPQFFAAGDTGLLQAGRPRVAIIGSRDSSEDGIKRARRLGRELASAGIIVVSGLAKGIDRAAHDGAIEAGGKTIAVIGTPVQKCYPAEHARLQEHIYREHLLVSQFPAGARTFPSDFVKRNRFMAALSNATVVVEAGESSGTLSQAAETQRLGRHLFIMASVLDNKALAWPEKFLRPKAGPAAHLLKETQQIIEVLA